MNRLLNQSTFLYCLLMVVLIGCMGNRAIDDDNGRETAVSGPEATSHALATAIVASAESPYDPQAAQTQLDNSIALWDSHSIAAYAIEVRHVRPTWNTQIFELMVEDGEVTAVNHSCYPVKDCVLKEVDPQTLTIAHMYDVAQQIIPRVDLGPEVTFHATYGYPTYIGNDDASWVFSKFEIIQTASDQG